MRHANFLPLKFTVGKAHDLGLRYTCSDELVPIKDEFAESVSLRHREQAHERVQPEVPIQSEAFVEPKALFDPKAPVQTAEEVGTESINSLETESNQGDDMVTRRTMTISRFVPGARPTTQQQPPQGQDQTLPPPPPTSRTRKRPRTAEQTPAGSGDASTRTPSRPSGGIVI